jgi:hypothetical protein
MKTQFTERSERKLLSEFVPAASHCEGKRRGLIRPAHEAGLIKDD